MRSTTREPRHLPIATRTIFESESGTTRDFLVFCPMTDVTQPIDCCSRCAYCEGFDALGDSSTRPGVRCAYGEPAGSHGRPIASILAPLAFCVRAGAVRAVLKRKPPGLPLVLVDDDLRFTGLWEPGPTVRIDDGSLLAIEEHASPWTVLGRLRRERKWFVPVVSSRRRFLGLVDQADIARALRGLLVVSGKGGR